MPFESRVNLSLTLQPPPGEENKDVFEKVIENVPRSVAEEILQDFEGWDPESKTERHQPETERYRMYRVGEGAEERLIALDFGDVASLLVE